MVFRLSHSKTVDLVNAESRNPPKTARAKILCVLDRTCLVFECPHLQTLRDKYVALFGVPTMVQIFWRDDLVNVFKFICECIMLDVMLAQHCWVLTLTIKVRHLISPRWLEEM